MPEQQGALSRDEPSASERLGELLAAARESAELSQAQMADALGVERSTYANWEVSSRRPRRFWSLLPKIARITGKSLYYFFGLPEPDGLSHEARALAEIYDKIKSERSRRLVYEVADNALRQEGG